MGRLVDPKPASGRLFASDAPQDAVKEYLERVARYVPAEIIAAYLTGLPVISGSTDPDTTLRTTLYAVLFVGCLLLTPFYFRFMARPGQPKRLQMLVSAIAFCVWAYSLQGLFEDIGIYQEAVAALALIFFSLISGLVAPTEESP